MSTSATTKSFKVGQAWQVLACGRFASALIKVADLVPSPYSLRPYSAGQVKE